MIWDGKMPNFEMMNEICDGDIVNGTMTIEYSDDMILNNNYYALHKKLM